MQRSTFALVVVWLALAAVPFVAGAVGSTYMLTLASRIVILAMVALSLDLLVGWAGLVSFGHAAFFGLGGYVAAIAASLHQDGAQLFGVAVPNEALVIWPLAMLVAALAGLVIGLLSLRTRGVYFIMITLAFAQMLYFFFVALKSWGGDDGLAMSTRNLVAGIKIVDAQTFYWLCFGLLSLVWLALGRMVNARFGLVLRGAKASARRMAAIGFDVRHYQCLAFVLAAAVAGLGGALWANLGRFVAPDMLSWTRSGDFLVMVILGGSGTVLGPVVGAALYLLLETQLAGMSQYWQMMFGPLVVAVALFLPRGLCAIDGGGRDG